MLLFSTVGPVDSKQKSKANDAKQKIPQNHITANKELIWEPSVLHDIEEKIICKVFRPSMEYKLEYVSATKCINIARTKRDIKDLLGVFKMQHLTTCDGNITYYTQHNTIECSRENCSINHNTYDEWVQSHRHLRSARPVIRNVSKSNHTQSKCVPTNKPLLQHNYKQDIVLYAQAFTEQVEDNCLATITMKPQFHHVAPKDVTDDDIAVLIDKDLVSVKIEETYLCTDVTQYVSETITSAETTDNVLEEFYQIRATNRLGFINSVPIFRGYVRKDSPSIFPVVLSYTEERSDTFGHFDADVTQVDSSFYYLSIIIMILLLLLECFIDHTSISILEYLVYRFRGR